MGWRLGDSETTTRSRGRREASTGKAARGRMMSVAIRVVVIVGVVVYSSAFENMGIGEYLETKDGLLKKSTEGRM